MNEPSDRAARGGRRLVLVGAVLLAAFHVFATFVWIAPPSGMRNVFPGDSLRSYMVPLFGQNWSVFAPAPVNGDYSLDIRARIEADGEVTETPWVSATEAELTLLTGNLFPPRATIVTWTEASSYRKAYDALTDEQRKIVALSYAQIDDWRDRLERAIEKNGDNPRQIASYLAADERLTAYATQAAYALWGDDVVAVQFRVSRQGIVPFDKRTDPDAQRPDPRRFDTGWRGLVEYPGQSRDAFGDVFRDLVERSGQAY